MYFSRSAIICVAMVIAAYGCSKKEGTSVTPQSIQVGGLYAAQDQDGSWRVMKVLVVDEHAVHLRSYANKFREQPKDVDPASLSLGGLNDPAGFGIGHFPLAKEGFFKDKPVLIKVVPVKEEELEGYKMYLEAMNGGGGGPASR
jgi:hypothetical protein